MTDVPLSPTSLARDPAEPARSTTGGPAPGGGDEIAHLEQLHTRLLDTLAGHDTLLERVEAADREPVEAFESLYRSHLARVQGLLGALGQTPAEGGSLAAPLNRAAAVLRVWLDSDGARAALMSGAEAVLKDLEVAIDASPSPERKGALSGMRDELTELLQRHLAPVL